jgi:lipoprotein-anchoring transpeptidase ErfK/SrfK
MLGTSSLAQCFALLCFFSAALLLTMQQQGISELLAPSDVVTPYSPYQRTSQTAQAASREASHLPAPDLPVPTDAPKLVVDLSDRKVYLYREETLQTSYDVAVGQAAWPTPTGEFQVLEMYTNPAWQHPITGEVVAPGPDNPLGSRWIGFWQKENWQIGFHGTNETDLIGQAVSHGCIRMRNEDIQALYDQVQTGSVVIVRA